MVKKQSILSRNTLHATLALFVMIIVLVAADVFDDYLEGQSWTHISIELIVVALSLLGVAVLGRQFMVERKQQEHRLQSHIALIEGEAQHWRTQSQSLMQGLGVEIHHQFKRWGLTQAESEIGLLMLKGFSHQEIAQLRQASERTVREQARAVYRKAGLSGKAELSAFFLEDLLLPPVDTVAPNQPIKSQEKHV